MNFGARWNVEIDPSVLKETRRFPAKDRRRIQDALASLEIDPFSGDIQKMQDEDNAWRRRVGSYRIFFAIMQTSRTVLVFRMKQRTSSTY